MAVWRNLVRLQAVFGMQIGKNADKGLFGRLFPLQYREGGLVMGRHAYLMFLVLCLGGAMLACIPGGDGTDNSQAATADALRTQVATGPTAEVADTPAPAGATDESDETTDDGTEAQPTEDPSTDLMIAQENATAVSEASTATAVARNMSAEEATVQAQATLDPVLAELATFGVDPAGGRLAWVHPPVTIDASGYMTYEYDIDFITPAQDFVLVSDITWNTQFGSTGCGYAMHSDADGKAGNRHLAIATRFANGEVIFVNQIDGNLIRDDIQRLNPNGIDPLFEWQNDLTNRIAVVARGNIYSVFTNGSYLGDFVAEAGGLERGFVAFVALNESGFTHCEFTNAWLWLIE